MSDVDSRAGDQEDHQAAYVFDPYEGDARPERPAKRRRTSKKGATPKGKAGVQKRSHFVPLLQGKEKPEAIQRREKLFRETWSRVEGRIKRMLRDANSATLEDVGSFVETAKDNRGDKISCAFVVTGPNLASQDLLFEQLEESLLTSTANKFVRLRSADATNMKATLKKIIQDITCKASDEEDGQLMIGKSNRKYLNYDLAAVHAVITAQGGCDHVFIAFQDSEGFDSALLSDLVLVFSNWPQIPFTLLFGVATSVELLQGRLRKSVCEHLQGTEFDVTQGTSILEDIIIKTAVTSLDIPLLVGGSLLETMINRQYEKVAGVQDFISALKYAYMCHYYANPLSVFEGVEYFEKLDWIQPEHYQALRSLPSFAKHIEKLLAANNSRSREKVIEWLKDDDFLIGEARAEHGVGHGKALYVVDLHRAASILAALGYHRGRYATIVIEILNRGIDLTDDHEAVIALRKMDPERIISAMKDMRSALSQNNYGDIPADEDSNLRDALAHEAHADENVCDDLTGWIDRSEKLLSEARAEGHTLRSKYSGQTKIVRTTVVAQKVQLSHDSAALTEVDEKFTKVVDKLVSAVKLVASIEPPTHSPFHEIWYYDSRIPHKEVFTPRLRAVFERALARPRDYLACQCCGDGSDGGEAISPLSPPASILYHFYQEAGSLINVADLWTAFFGVVATDAGVDADERAALALFYQGLAELKSLGFVKPSKKKTDHIAKLKWL